MRSFIGFISASLLTFLLTPFIIRFAKDERVPIKEELEEHQAKAGTPALGGVALVLSFALSLFFLPKTGENGVLLAASVLFFCVGFFDDFLKIKKHSSDGCTSLQKLFLQIVTSAIVAYLVQKNTQIYHFLSPVIYYPLAVFYLVSLLNAINIVDGLDTLCIKSVLPAFLLIIYAFSTLQGSALLLVSCLFSFLCFNSHPASIFLGDSGSHLVGGLFGTMALLSGHPLVLLIAVLIPILEMGSSFLQIVAIRLFHRKLFSIAPYHHALQKRGMAESKIADIFFFLSTFASFLAVFLLSLLS